MGNFRWRGSHTADDLCFIMHKVLRGSLGGKIPNYYVSDSAPVNKSAVRKLMVDRNGNYYWFPCCAHFLQLSMREAVRSFLVRNRSNSDVEEDDFDWDGLNSNAIDNAIPTTTTNNSFERLPFTCRALRAAIRRSHIKKELFLSYQNSLNMHISIVADIPTRLGSIVDLFDILFKNRAVLQRMQENGDRNPNTWHLTTDDFDML